MPSSPKRSCAYSGCSELVALGYCEKHKVYSYYPSLKTPLMVRVVMVTGAPGSGKTFYVEQNKKPGDIVIDLDEIKSELTGKPMYAHHDQATIDRAIQVRNRRIENLVDECVTDKTLWLVVCAGSTNDRLAWKRILLTYNTFVMMCSLETCIERILARSSETELEQIEAAKKWFKNFALMGNEIIVDTEKRN